VNYYPHHIGDYLTDTAHLTMVEDGAYRRLLDLYYSRERPIPADVSRVCRLVRAATVEERGAVESVLAEFFFLDGDAWRHKRCDREILKAAAARTKARENGLKGGRPKGLVHNPEKTQPVISGFPNGNLDKTQGKAPNPNPNPNTQSIGSSTVSEGVQGESQSVAAAPHRRAPAKQPQFSPPSVADVAEYCQERGNCIDAEHFHSHYTANGWRVGKTSMRDWRAAVRTWEKRDEKHEQYSAGPKKSDFERNLEFLKRRSGEII
jgi:uncharacterized protein YdaU (DUF1376 family)